MFEDKNPVQVLVTIVEAPLGPGVALVIVTLSMASFQFPASRKYSSPRAMKVVRMQMKTSESSEN